MVLRISNVSLLYYFRELYNKSVRAFVSFVRFYNKHECHVIFNAKGTSPNYIVSKPVHITPIISSEIT